MGVSPPHPPPPFAHLCLLMYNANYRKLSFPQSFKRNWHINVCSRVVSADGPYKVRSCSIFLPAQLRVGYRKRKEPAVAPRKERKGRARKTVPETVKPDKCVKGNQRGLNEQRVILTEQLFHVKFFLLFYRVTGNKCDF